MLGNNLLILVRLFGTFSKIFQVTITVNDAKDAITDKRYDENQRYLLGYSLGQAEDSSQVKRIKIYY